MDAADSPVIEDFTQSPQDRVIAAFALGILLFCSTVLFVRALAWSLLGSRLRHAAPPTSAGQTLQERLEHLESTQGLPPDTARDLLVKALGGRQGFVQYHEGVYTWPCLVIILSLGLSSVSHLVTLVTFSVNNDVPCAFFVALGGISLETAYVGGLYEIGTELMNIGASSREFTVLRIFLVIPLIVTIIGQALATGTVVALPTVFPADSGLCYQSQYVPTVATLGALNLALGVYAFLRFFLHLAPGFLSFGHRFQGMFDLRIGWAMSLILLELLTFVPTITLTNYALSLIPFSIGGIVVMIAFSFHPSLEEMASTISVLPSEGDFSTSRAVDTGSTRFDMSDHGRAGYEEYKQRWSRSMTAPLPPSSSVSPIAEEKRRASHRSTGSGRKSFRRSHSSPAGVQFHTIESVLSRVSEARDSPEPPARTVRPFSTYIEHPEAAATRHSGAEPSARESVARRGSFFKSLPPLPNLPPVTLSDGTKRSFIDLSKRQSFRLSPPSGPRPRLILHIPSTSTVQAYDGHSPTRSRRSSLIALDGSHHEASVLATAPPGDRHEHRRDEEAQTPNSAKSKKTPPRSRRTSKHITIHTTDMPVSKRISIGASGDVVIEIAEPSQPFDGISAPRDHDGDHPMRSASSPRPPRGPRAPPPRQSSRQMPRTAPFLGQFQDHVRTPS